MKKKVLRFFILTLMALMFVAPFAKVETQAKRIFTGNSKVDCAAEAIISRCTTDDMTGKEKLKACFTYLVKHMKFTWYHDGGKIKIKPTKAEKAEYKALLKRLKASGKVEYSKKFKTHWSNLLRMHGTCYDMSGVMCILANHLGYKAGKVTGTYLTHHGTKKLRNHWWNWVKINGKKYYCDVQGCNAGKHTAARINAYCLKRPSDKDWREHHRF